MTLAPHLTPSASPAQLYPGRAAFMSRTDEQQLRLIGVPPFALDTITTTMMGLLNGMPTVRHRAGATDAIVAVLERAGLPVDEDMRVFDRLDEAERHADAFIEDGYKLAWPYPLREGRFSEGAHLVCPELWRDLNAKENLGALVPVAHLARRRVHTIEELAALPFESPVFVKAGSRSVTGAGFAVRYCQDEAAWRAAIDWFHSIFELEHLVVEEALEVDTCWCVNFTIAPERISILGAAEQLFASPGRQSGSMIDPENAFPDSGKQLVMQVGAAAGQRGFIGVAGLDIGRTMDGRLIVFDPNFRMNACSAQILLHASAAARAGLPASASVNVPARMDFAELEDVLRGPIEEGWFVPTRLIDGRLHPLSDGACTCTGFVLGADRADGLRRKLQLEKALSPAA
jgi:hypothetical protein